MMETYCERLKWAQKVEQAIAGVVLDENGHPKTRKVAIDISPSAYAAASAAHYRSLLLQQAIDDFVLAQRKGGIGDINPA